MASVLLRRRPALCASLMGRNRKEFLRALPKARGADVLELRADSLDLPDPEEIKELITRIKHLTKLPVLLTLRPEWEGGLFTGSEDERFHLLRECGALAEGVDIELNTNPRRRNVIIENMKKKGKEIIISCHDFEGTPGEDEAVKILKKGFKAGADIAKFAAMPKTKGDVFELMVATREASKLGNVCTISMGELGKVSRIIAPFYGSCMTYVSAGREAAPGQMEVGDMLEILKMVGLR